MNMKNEHNVRVEGDAPALRQEHFESEFAGSTKSSRLFKHPQFLADANKWCHNNMETRDVHASLKPLHDSRRTQIVKIESKVAWVRAKRMPSDHTRNHSWRIAHQIALHAQPTHRCKCGKRNTMDHVHFGADL